MNAALQKAFMPVCGILAPGAVGGTGEKHREPFCAATVGDQTSDCVVDTEPMGKAASFTSTAQGDRSLGRQITVTGAIRATSVSRFNARELPTRTSGTSCALP